MLGGCLLARSRKMVGNRGRKALADSWESPVAFHSSLLSCACLLGSDPRLQHGEPPAGPRELRGLFPQPAPPSQGTAGF